MIGLPRNNGDVAMSASRDTPHEQLHHQHLLEALPVAIYATDAAGKITYFNQATAAFVGEQSHLHGEDWWVSWRLFHPDGTALSHAEFPMAVILRERRPVRGQFSQSVRTVRALLSQHIPHRYLMALARSAGPSMR